jgi:hypothetical protein
VVERRGICSMWVSQSAARLAWRSEGFAVAS